MSFVAENSIYVFLVLTVIIGGGAAWLTGRATALSWKPLWRMFAFMLMLGAAVRFFHFALFGETLLSLHYYLTDTAVLVFFAFLGYRLTRTSQMVTQYGWLYKRTSPFTWKELKG